jgi:hypothetical protein
MGRGGKTCSVCRESCDTHSSPEPAALWFGGGRVGRGKRRDATSTLRAVMLTAVQSLRRAGGERSRWESASTEPRVPGAWSERVCRRTPCARESCNSDSSPEPSAACSEGAGSDCVEGDLVVWG